MSKNIFTSDRYVWPTKKVFWIAMLEGVYIYDSKPHFIFLCQFFFKNDFCFFNIYSCYKFIKS